MFGDIDLYRFTAVMVSRMVSKNNRL